MKKSLLALILASIVAMSLSAQFTAETRLVIVNLSAKDKSGKPIMTLKKEDVEVYRRQRQAGHQSIRAAKARRRSAPSHRRHAARNRAPSRKKSKSSPEPTSSPRKTA